MFLYFLSIDACENVNVLKVYYYVKELLNIIFFLIPVALILMVTIDFAKNVISKDEEAMKANTSLGLKRIIYAVVIFLIPFVVRMAINSFVDSEVGYGKCLNATLETIKKQTKKNRDECDANGNEWDEVGKECLLKPFVSNKSITVFNGSKLIASNVSEELYDYGETNVLVSGSTAERIVTAAKQTYSRMVKYTYRYSGLDKGTKYYIPLTSSKNPNPNKASCATFVNQVLYTAGLCKSGNRWYTAGSSVKSKLKAKGISFTTPSTPRPGDIFHTSGWSHTGIVASVHGNTIETYEVVRKTPCAVHKKSKKWKGMHFIRLT